MIRPGHHRPIGTTTKSRFEWSGDRIPELGDIAFQNSGEGTDDYGDVRRAYLIVGFEEGRTRGSFRLVMERLDFDDAVRRAMEVAEDAVWFFYNMPRR